MKLSGCAGGQGWLFAGAMPEAMVSRFIAERRWTAALRGMISGLSVASLSEVVVKDATKQPPIRNRRVAGSGGDGATATGLGRAIQAGRVLVPNLMAYVARWKPAAPAKPERGDLNPKPAIHFEDPAVEIIVAQDE